MPRLKVAAAKRKPRKARSGDRPQPVQPEPWPELAVLICGLAIVQACALAALLAR